MLKPGWARRWEHESLVFAVYVAVLDGYFTVSSFATKTFVTFPHREYGSLSLCSAQTRDADILDQVVKLSSHISRKEAMRKLSRMRKDRAFKESFTNSLPVFLLVHQLLADYRFASLPWYSTGVLPCLSLQPCG